MNPGRLFARTFVLALLAGLGISATGAGAPRPKAAPRPAPARQPLGGAHGLARSLPCTAEFFEVAGRPAFLLLPAPDKRVKPTPWVWYAPSLAASPHAAHIWMFRQFLEKGIAIAGIDVGESCGNPAGRAQYTAFMEELRDRRGMTPKAVLLPQSRGGLMLYNWAAEHPESVAAVAGIYTVCNIVSWPGLAKAAPAYGMTEAELGAHVAEHNPIDRLAPLARAGVPIMHLAGDNDKVVPLELNSGELARRYKALGGKVNLVVIPGKGHEVVKEYFERQDFVDFVIEQALSRGK